MSKETDDFEELVEKLSQEIYSGALRPGEWLKQIDVVKRHDAKPFSARKAFQRLQEKGLAEYEKNRGYKVAHPSETELRQVKEIRCILEVGATEDILRNMKKRTLQSLRKLAEEFDEAIETGSKEDLRNINFAFHDKMVRQCGNPMLADMIDELRKRQIPGTRDVWSTVRQMRVSAQEHFDMLDAIEADDLSRFRDVVHHHIIKDIENTLPLRARKPSQRTA
ncbi:MAG: GntR family transcriptional regulator [Roseibium sp.]|uniref:GntR family transcriptional regulator n=1 Tax=Roseibium sp. TaxID=1936156 RepID=UPI00262D11AB|nr:GntR family transcriptional regulator [Roseibium sp.]MCV0426437.1 GntR family transcriptional regulator [Roseibium sp.]